MNKEIPRLRMFAGPNGSGKSTFKSIIRPELLGIYINPDEIEKEIRERNFLDLQGYQIATTAKEIINFFIHSPLLKTVDLLDDAHGLCFNDEKLSFSNVGVNAYFASVAADFIRNSSLNVQNLLPLRLSCLFPPRWSCSARHKQGVIEPISIMSQRKIHPSIFRVFAIE